MHCDLILTGGHVIDPANQVSGVMDVAVKDGKIATEYSIIFCEK